MVFLRMTPFGGWFRPLSGPHSSTESYSSIHVRGAYRTTARASSADLMWRRGSGRKLRQFYHKDLIEGGDWLWGRFVRDITTQFPVLAQPQFVSVGVSYIPMEKARYIDSPDAFFAQKDSFEASRIFFQIGADQRLELLSLTANEASREIAEYCQGTLRAATTLAVLLNNLREFPLSDWSWVNLYIGTVIAEGPVAKLWKNYLEPWCGWVESRG